MRETVRNSVLMLLENNPYQLDIRVKLEARTLIRAGYRVCVISPRPKDTNMKNIMDGVHLYQYPPILTGYGFLGYILEYGYAMIATFVLSLFVLLRKGFYVIHAHCPPDTFVLIAAFYKLLGKRFVYDHHDLAPELYNARFSGKGNRFVFCILVFFEKFSCRLADIVVATNQSYKKVEMQRGHVAAESITIVRNGPDLNILHPTKPDSNLLQEGRVVLVYVGVMGFQDGVDYLLRALHHLLYDLGKTDFFCFLVGDGDALSNLKTMAKQLCLSDILFFTGRVMHEEVPRFLGTADICLAPEPSNAYNDRSTAIKIMEYMAMGKPIVAFDLPEHRVTAKEAALYARQNDELDFANRIAILIDDPKRCFEMGKIGRKRVETELSWQHQEKNLLKAYETLTSDE